MVVVYILLGILAVLLLYICFLAICSLCVDPKKEYEKNSRFYRTLLTALLPLLWRCCESEYIQADWRRYLRIKS